MEVLDDNTELVATEVETNINQEEITSDENLDSTETSDEQAV
jgi:hypothetical protein